MEPRSNRHKSKPAREHDGEKNKKSIVLFNLVIISSLIIILFVIWKTVVYIPDNPLQPQVANETEQGAGTTEVKPTESTEGEPLSTDNPDAEEVGEQTGEEEGVEGTEEIEEIEESEGAEGGVEETEQTEGEAVETISGQSDTVSLAFVGDILIADYVQPIVDKFGYDHLFEEVLLYLSEPDITVGNLEMPITEAGQPIEQKYVYKGSPAVIKPLMNAGFDVMSLANNHAFDQGEEGLLDTIKHLNKAGLAHTGTGKNSEEAYKPVIKKVGDISVAFVSLSHVIPQADFKVMDNRAGIAETYDMNRAIDAIEAAKQAADIAVVLIHWGEERVTTLTDKQLAMGKAYIDAGADLVIGHHPHILQGFEQYNGKWIAYSLGNFVFSTYPKEAEAETAVLDAVCNKAGDCQLQIHPMEVKLAQPVPMEEEQAQQLLEKLQTISVNARIDKQGYIRTSKR